MTDWQGLEAQLSLKFGSDPSSVRGEEVTRVGTWSQMLEKSLETKMNAETDVITKKENRQTRP